MYSKYSQKGNKNKTTVKDGNFLSYVERAMNIFTKKDNRSIACVKNRHYKKIKNKL